MSLATFVAFNIAIFWLFAGLSCQRPQDRFNCLPKELQTADVKVRFLQQAALMLGQNSSRF